MYSRADVLLEIKIASNKMGERMELDRLILAGLGPAGAGYRVSQGGCSWAATLSVPL
jgi:hypothetical protein